MQKYINLDFFPITLDQSKPGLCPKTGETAVSFGFSLNGNITKESAYYSQACYNTFLQNHGSMLFYHTDTVSRKQKNA